MGIRSRPTNRNSAPTTQLDLSCWVISRIGKGDDGLGGNRNCGLRLLVAGGSLRTSVGAMAGRAAIETEPPVKATFSFGLLEVAIFVEFRNDIGW